MKIIKCEQGTLAWFMAKRGIPSASEFNRIMTPKECKLSAQHFGYACELVGQLFDSEYGYKDDFATAAMRNGTIIEPEARKWYEFDAGVEIQQVGFVLHDLGRIGCSPDGLANSTSGDDDGGIELKCPEAKTHIEWLMMAKEHGDKWFPPEHKNQVHGCLIVTGRKWWDFCSYRRGLPPLRVRVTPGVYTESLKGCLNQFLEKYTEVLNAMPPPPVEPAPPPILDEVMPFTGSEHGGSVKLGDQLD